MELQIKNLSKTYSNGVQALKNVSLTIPQGMFGLLGPNGAGKSSLMRTLATLQQADSGSVMLDDIDVLNDKSKVRKILGYLPQEFGVYPKVSSYNMLDHIASLKGISNKRERKDLVESLLNKTNLWHVRNKSLGTYSGGMKQRFGIAQALLCDPQLVIVDEPTAGLDPGERNRFYNLLAEIGESASIEVTEAEMQQALMAQVQQYPGQEKQIYEFFQNNPDALGGLRAPIFEDKVVDHILEGASVEDKTVSKEELMKEDELPE